MMDAIDGDGIGSFGLIRGQLKHLFVAGGATTYSSTFSIK